MEQLRKLASVTGLGLIIFNLKLATIFFPTKKYFSLFSPFFCFNDDKTAATTVSALIFIFTAILQLFTFLNPS